MPVLRVIAAGLRTLVRKNDVERDLHDEVEQYLEMATQAHVRDGLAPDAARRAARIELGGVEATKENVRSSGWDASVETLIRNIRYSLRALRRNPAFTIVVVLTLALGIGVNTAMFSVVNAVMLRSLPYRDAHRLALIYTDDARRGLHEEATAFLTITDWQKANRTFEDIAFYNVNRATLTRAGERDRTRSAFASGNLFSVLGATPLRGRTISPSDQVDAERVAVISYSLWQRRFGLDSAVIGQTLDIEETENEKGSRQLRIIGVMPQGFYFPDKQTEIWTPATTYWRFRRESIEHFPQWARRWTAVGRLKPAASPAIARSDLARIGAHLSATYQSDVADFPGFVPNVVPMLDHVAGKDLQSALWTLLGAVGFVLLVACANVANLLLARGAARQHEFAIRRALGAGRLRIARQLVAESMVLAVAGGAGGILLAVLGTRALAIVAVNRIPRIEEVSVDLNVLLFAAVTSLIAGIVFGIAPAFRLSKADASATLKAGRQASGNVQMRRTRALLVVVECALAIVLLSGAGLLLRSLARVRSIQPGFDPGGVLTVRVEFPPEAPPSAEERTQTSRIAPARARAREQLLRGLTARVEAIPGVEAVGFADDMFISGKGNKSITIPGHATDSLGAGELNDGSMTPGFFNVMRVPLHRGRYLTHDDVFTKIHALWSPVVTDMSLADKERLAIPEPVVVNDAFVRRFFPTEDPLGQRFCIDPTNKTYWYVIVGVIADMHRQGLEKKAIPEYFGAYLPVANGRADLLVRTRRDPSATASIVRQTVKTVIPNVLIGQISTAEQQLGDFAAERDFMTWLLGMFAALALGLAVVGIYGVVHYAVAERRREIGVRIALGASPAAVLAMVIRRGMLLPVAGIAIGLTASAVLTRVMARWLFETEALDPLTFGAVAAVLTSGALVACYFPARSAASVDPVRTLRQE
ncbi:MAG TPA: ABC transporter permease [Gemmatimonadaceae bacterium]|nr:ABC transporter permease [Gemmatimonadaceae bacterium]